MTSKAKKCVTHISPIDDDDEHLDESAVADDDDPTLEDVLIEEFDDDDDEQLADDSEPDFDDDDGHYLDLELKDPIDGDDIKHDQMDDEEESLDDDEPKPGPSKRMRPITPQKATPSKPPMGPRTTKGAAARKKPSPPTNVTEQKQKWGVVFRNICAVRDCHCSNTGAYFPNPYRITMTVSERQREEDRLAKWIEFCGQPKNWVPLFAQGRFSDYIGWQHFATTSTKSFERQRKGKAQTVNRLSKGALPTIKTIKTRAEAIMELCGADTLRAYEEHVRVRNVAKSSSPHVPKALPPSKQPKTPFISQQAMQGTIQRYRALFEAERRLRRDLDEKLKSIADGSLVVVPLQRKRKG